MKPTDRQRIKHLEARMQQLEHILFRMQERLDVAIGELKPVPKEDKLKLKPPQQGAIFVPQGPRPVKNPIQERPTP